MIQSLDLFLKAGHLNKASLFGCSQLCCVSPKEGAVVKQMQSKVIREVDSLQLLFLHQM